MTLTEVVVSAAILGISTQVGLQGWVSTAKNSASAALIDQQHQRLEQRLLASRRLLQAPGVVDAACRFDADAVDGVLAALPQDSALLERWVWDPLEPATRLWLTVQLVEAKADLDPPRERRLLFTPAGLGHCPREAP
jgi:type II secretory pathway pseudopilin PulG